MGHLMLVCMLILLAGCAGGRKDPLVRVDIINVERAADDDDEVIVRRAVPVRRYK
jgi:lipoprotein NlpI